MSTSTPVTPQFEPAGVRALEYPLTAEQRAVRDHVRAFAAERLAPIAEEMDQSEDYPVELARIMGESGLWSYFFPEEYGGAGHSSTNLCLIRHELARICPTADELFAAQGLPINALVLHGSDELRQRYAPGIIDGTNTFSICLTEPAAGSDVGGIQTIAEDHGDHFLLTGTKRFVFGPAVATHFLVFAKTDPELGKRGISAFIVDMPAEGVAWRDYKLFKAGPETEVTFDRTPVPAGNMVGRRGAGIRVALGDLAHMRPTVGAAAVGMAEAALAAAIEHVKTRQAFGGHLADLETVRFKVASAAAELDAARLLVYAAAANADGDALDVGMTAAKAKWFATETAFRVIDTAVQLHGGSGLRRGSVPERMMKAVRATRIYEGANEVMQLVIGRGLFGASH